MQPSLSEVPMGASVLTVAADPKTRSSTEVSAELARAIEDLNMRRGSTEAWFKMEHQLLVFIAGTSKHQRIWAKGEVHGHKRHYPAVLVYDEEATAVKAMAPSGEDGMMEEHPIHLFWNSIPHKAHCRAVIDHDQRNSTI